MPRAVTAMTKERQRRERQQRRKTSTKDSNERQQQRWQNQQQRWKGWDSDSNEKTATEMARTVTAVTKEWQRRERQRQQKQRQPPATTNTATININCWPCISMMQLWPRKSECAYHRAIYIWIIIWAAQAVMARNRLHLHLVRLIWCEDIQRSWNPLVLELNLVLGVDILHISRQLQFIVCAIGAFGFLLLYGFFFRKRKPQSITPH